jgi:hypothetical protein
MLERSPHSPENTLEHPAIGLINTVLAADASRRPEAWHKFRKHVWDLPCWVPGRINEHGGTNFLFRHHASALPTLTMFADEQAARAHCAVDPFLPIPFKFAIYLVNDTRYDLECVFGQHKISLAHDRLLAMRDIAKVQAAQEPPATLRERAAHFVRRARQVSRF